MCHTAVNKFIEKTLKPDIVSGKSILEVGSYNINGSIRNIATAYGPSEYIGIDLNYCDHKTCVPPCVDEICDANNIIEKFGINRFDIVVTTELLEHVVDWKGVIHNLKLVLKPSGSLVLTTRSPGFRYHPAPVDNWRFTFSNMKVIFSDFIIERLEDDLGAPGVFINAKKPNNFCEIDLSNYEVPSVNDPDFYYVIVNGKGFVAEDRIVRCFQKYDEAKVLCNALNKAVEWECLQLLKPSQKKQACMLFIGCNTTLCCDTY